MIWEASALGRGTEVQRPWGGSVPTSLEGQQEAVGLGQNQVGDVGRESRHRTALTTGPGSPAKAPASGVLWLRSLVDVIYIRN